MSRACLISNTDSGANVKRGLDKVARVASASGLRHRTIDDIDKLDAVLRECAENGDGLIIVNGGDGTVRRVLEHVRNSGLFPAEPALALLRGGTTNMIHKDLGIPGRPEAALRRLLAVRDRNAFTVRRRHVLRIAGPAYAEPMYGFFLGTNAVLKGILRTRARLHQVSVGWPSELLSIGGMAWRLFRRRVDRDPVLAPVGLEIRRDRETWQHTEHIMLLAMTVQTAILGVHPLRHGQRAGMALLSWPDYRLMPWLGRFLSGRLEAFESLSLRGGFGWILDGEVHEHHPADGALDIEVGNPASFMVLR